MNALRDRHLWQYRCLSIRLVLKSRRLGHLLIFWATLITHGARAICCRQGSLRRVMMIVRQGETLVAESPNNIALKRVEDRSYTTYKARLNAASRLRHRGAAWNASLVALSVSTTAASVALLSDPMIYGPRGATLLAVLAVLALASSLVVTNMNYPGRAQAMEANFRRLQQISLTAEAAQIRPDLDVDPEQVRREYEIALESSENHSDADYLRTQARTRRATRIILGDRIVTVLPWFSLVVTALVVYPLAVWLLDG